jgi:hypothetical protein
MHWFLNAGMNIEKAISIVPINKGNGIPLFDLSCELQDLENVSGKRLVTDL